MENKDFVKALEILSNAKITAEKEKNYEGVYCAMNTMAECYYYMLDYGEALRIALDTYELARERLDVKRENKSLINIGALYLEDKNYKKGEEYLIKAYNSLKQQKDFSAMSTALTNLGDAAVMLGNYKLAMSRYNEVLKLTPQTSKSAVNAKVGIIECELYFGKIKLARQKAEALYKDKVSQKSYNKDLQLLYIIAESYLKEKEYDMAISIISNILKEKPDMHFKNKSFKLLVTILKQKGDFRTALVYKDSVMSTEQKLSEINNGRLFEANKVKFEITNYKNQLSLKDERIASERKIFYSLLSIFGLATVFAGLALRQKKHIADRNRKIAELELTKRLNDNLLLEKQIKEKEISAQLEQERLKTDNLLLEKKMLEKEMLAQQEQKSLQNEIEERNRMLSAKALYLSGRNELVEEIINAMGQLPQVVQNQEVSNYVSTLKSYLKTDSEWDSFIVHFEQVNPNFLKALQHKHPVLSLAQIRFLCYIYMNLNLKEISIILNITLESCKKRKQRIAKTMGVDPEELYSYILSLNS